MEEDNERRLTLCGKSSQPIERKLRIFPVKHVFSLTSNADGRVDLVDCPEILKLLVIYMQYHSASQQNRKKAALSLVNITGDEAGAEAILNLSKLLIPEQQYVFNMNIVEVCMKSILNKFSFIADECCMILSNITRIYHLVDRVVESIEQNGWTWNTILSALITKNYNANNAEMHYLASVINNLSQSSCVRRKLMDPQHRIIHRLCRYIQCYDEIRQRGIVGTLKNCTFETDSHDWLLNSDVHILPRLLLPLAGPEEFEAKDVAKLPNELQYLPETKQRDRNPEIRLMLLEALNQLCATKLGREYLREKNTYIILREFHKWEKDNKCLLACENVIDILIKTEEEIGVDNLKEVEVPSECTEKFYKMDQDFIEDT
ncbi:protein HGH1 homolog [Linepithema humile]|uniref:protein HGH1 homolog n=1 Tax=Linepithema humile TaxID=83485 RepID=UPI0006238676|nr:PREDICTED: protein HGH1 homolog [Linepithema humile]